MAASYPSSVKSFTTKTSGQTVASSHVNDMQDETVAVEGALLNGFAHALKPTALGGQDLGTTSLPWGTGYFTGLPMDIGLCEGRLTLTTGLPVTTADVSAAASVYFTPYKGNRVALYDGTNWALYTFTELTLALGTISSGKPYDVFLYNNTGTLTLELLAWTNDTTRATALTTQNGVLVKTGATTRRYLGTFYTTSTTTTEDSYAKRFLWNYYNRVKRAMRVFDPANTWTYSTAAWRQANGNTANQLACVIGVAEVLVEATCRAGVSNSNAGVVVGVSIAPDAVTDPAVAETQLFACVTTPVAGYVVNPAATYSGYPAAGYRIFIWQEFSAATITTTWYGDNGGASVGPNSGIMGSVDG